MTRECPHCQFAMRPDLETCPFCGRDSEPWILFENTWWRQDEQGGWLRYEPFRPPTGWYRWEEDQPPWVTARLAVSVAVAAIR